MAKKLQKGSMWEQADADGDGVVTDEEIAMTERMIRLENNDKEKISLLKSEIEKLKIYIQPYLLVLKYRQV